MFWLKETFKVLKGVRLVFKEDYGLFGNWVLDLWKRCFLFIVLGIILLLLSDVAAAEKI